jgi:hypothetical protein
VGAAPPRRGETPAPRSTIRKDRCNSNKNFNHRIGEEVSLLIAKDSSNQTTQIILEALQQGDKTRGELFDLTGKGYPILVQALQQLIDKQLIESYFAPTETVSVLTYRIL